MKQKKKRKNNIGTVPIPVQINFRNQATSREPNKSKGQVYKSVFAEVCQNLEVRMERYTSKYYHWIHDVAGIREENYLSSPLCFFNC